MPYCINNPKRQYKGNEPSPKGLGYCASGEKEGKKMKGKDGNMWIKKGGKWIKYSGEKDKKFDCSKIILYKKKRKKNGTIYTHNIAGIPAEKGFIYKHIDYNQFEKEPSKIPSGFRKRKISKYWIEEFGCGDKKRIDEVKWSKTIHKGWKTYITLDNGGQPFLVAIKGKTVKIFIIKPDIKIIFGFELKPYHYTHLIKEYQVEKVFIGKSPKNESTIYSGGFGKKWDGNSVLLELPNNKYVFIGTEIYEFSTKDKIISFISPVRNNLVPYPTALSQDNAFFMLDKNYVPIEYINELKLNKTEMTDLYTHYYGHYTGKSLKKYAKKMKNVKIIQKRLW